MPELTPPIRLHIIRPTQWTELCQFAGQVLVVLSNHNLCYYYFNNIKYLIKNYDAQIF